MAERKKKTARGGGGRAASQRRIASGKRVEQGTSRD